MASLLMTRHIEIAKTIANDIIIPDPAPQLGLMTAESQTDSQAKGLTDANMAVMESANLDAAEQRRLNFFVIIGPILCTASFRLMPDLVAAVTFGAVHILHRSIDTDEALETMKASKSCRKANVACCGYTRVPLSEEHQRERWHCHAILACALYNNWWPMLTVLMYLILPMPLIFFLGSDSPSIMFNENDG
ncbi:hypothetical protein ZWY2020_050993 [Hordeum vulgare]|nr:hypothetical protein ZWY2020_050993 [Hordeum vulgare]